MKLVYREPEDQSGFGFLETEDGLTVAHAGSEAFIPVERRAHGERLVACWNAFEGLDTPDVELLAETMVRIGKDGARLADALAPLQGMSEAATEAIAEHKALGESLGKDIGPLAEGFEPDECQIPEGQWMKIAAMLLHRYALKGETVVITPEDIASLDALYPTGANLIAEDGEEGTVRVTLLPPGEEPSRLIVVSRKGVILS